MQKKNIISTLIIICILLNYIAVNSETINKKVRIGIYDSRAIAVAYAHSKLFNEQIKKLINESEQAKKEGSEKKYKELEEVGKAQQRLIHQQGFSIASVNNIIEKVKKSLPEIAKNSNVNLIVSKWEIIYQDDNAEFVDVTAQIVNLFEPKEKTLKTIRDLLEREPISIDKLPADF